MALNWFEVGIVKRSDGHNVVARAAYNARERIVDGRTNQVYDYRHLGDPEWKAIFAPEQAPGWVTERDKLWCAVERKEDKSTRPDQAQLARDFKIALPHELNAEQRIAVVRDFAQEFACKGMVVDAVIHAPHAHNDDRNWHVHMLLTMREIGPDGFGNKVRAWNQTAEFDRWKERWSELGSQHLERAGFTLEAERFRTGHLSRPERAKDAHDRGDHDHFESLLNEPLRHRGPEASGMEKRGRRTHTGDLNREIEERNKVRGIAREIREAYALSSDPHAFAEALERKDMMLARITKDDARRYAAEFAMTDKYVPQYRECEYAVATEQGKVYRLTRMTTGDSFTGIRDFTKPLDQQDYPSLDAALNEMQQRSKTPKLDRNAVIAEMTPTKPHYPSPGEAAISGWLAQSLPHTAAAMNAINIESEPQQVRSAYNSAPTPEAFHEFLKERGFHLARVTAADAADSHTQHWAAKRHGGYSPLLTEGEYIAVSDRGSAYRLNDRTVGHNVREVKAFMSGLDEKPMPTLREVQNEVHEKRLEEVMRREDGSRGDGSWTGQEVSLGGIMRAGETVLGAPALVFADLFESLFAPKITPEERRLGEVMEHERQVAAERAERQRSGHDRSR